MTRAHYAAIRDRLATLTASGKPVPATLGDPPGNQPLPYTFVTPRPATPRSVTAAGCDRELSEYFNVTLVHSSASNVLAMCEGATDLLHGWTPIIPGWRTFPLEVVDTQPVQTSTVVMDGPSNTYPRWAVLQVRLQATKE